MREQMGLNRPAIVRYLDWLGGAVVGDFGVSLITKASVAETIAPRFANTLFLAAYAAVIAVPMAIILGVIVALLRNSLFDRVANVVTLTSISSAGILPGLHPDPLSGGQDRLLPGHRPAQRGHDLRSIC